MSATVPPATAPEPAPSPAPAPAEDGMKTFRGQSLEELLPRIREELGADAVILRQRDGLKGGVGGFFQKRCVEVDARAGAKRVDTYAGASEAEARAALDGEDEAADFRDELDAELEAAAEAEAEERFSRSQPGPAAPAPLQPVPGLDAAIATGLESPAIRALFDAAAPFAEQLQVADAALAAPQVGAPAEAPPPAPAASAEVEPAAAPARPTQADTQELALVEGGLGPALAADIVSETVSHLLPFGTPRQLKRLVRTALARRIPVQGPRPLGGAALVLAGAGGSGKTLTVARLAAAYAARSDLDVIVVALRPRDGGAELRALLGPVGVEVEVFDTAADAQARIAGAGERALVLVDTPAVSPADAEGVRGLASDVRRLKGAEVHLCLPATLSAAAAKRVLATLESLKPAGIVLTHVDETPQVGAVVELAVSGGPPLAFVGRDTGLDGGLELADAAAVAALVLP
jgi:flagellar biosynthesis protein FlhF